MLRTFARMLGTLAALALLLEISARLVVFGGHGLDPRRVGLLRDLDPGSLVHYDTDPAIVYEYKPNLDVFFKLVAFRTNSRGLRDEEYAFTKPAGCYRVAVVGSSFTLPVGVSIEHAFHSVLERRLNSEAECYEFLNFAVGLHSPSQVLAMLRYRALAFDPDLVLVGVTSMAASRLLADSNSPPPRNVLDLVAPRVRSYFVKLLQSRLGERQTTFSAAPPQYPKKLALETDVIAGFANVSRRHGVPIVLLRLELDPRTPAPVEQAVEERAEREGLFYVDTRRAFAAARPSDFWIYELDPHPNAAAHAIFADVVEAFLRDRDLLGR